MSTYSMSAADAAKRLGVKQATLYAYVSRGVLNRRREPDGRGSLFDPDEVERLALRGRPRRAAGAADIIVESQITEITADQLHYRGLDVVELSRTHSFEDVAELLWTGTLPLASASVPPASVPPASVPPASVRPASVPPASVPPASVPPASVPPASVPNAQSSPLERAVGAIDTPTWQATPAALAAARAAQAALPAGTLPLERLQVIVPAMAATDPLRLQLDPVAVIAAARAIIAGMVDCLPHPAAASHVAAAPAALAGHAIAPRLWACLCERRAGPGLSRALSAALVLLADHELAASTLAARAAASVRADPYAVVATGLGAVGGALHGGSSLGAETLLAAASGPADVPRVVGELLRRGEKVPGFGHYVYKAGDPRAIALLDLIRRAAPKSAQLAIADAVLAEVKRKSLPEPNIDFALATLARVAGMVRGSGETIFAVARTAGWIAHALEAYTTAPIRPRAVYTGPVG